MKLSDEKSFFQRIKSIRINYVALAFFIPFLGMLMLMLLGRYEPFGNNRSMLYSDMFHQYYPFFVNFRENLLSGDGVLYNWDIGMGLDYLGLISYYLASPLNLLSVLVPESLTLEYFALLMPIKLGFASMFFALFLKKVFDKNGFSICVFGGFYGLCAWALGYQWNVMWLDSFALMPLVALGTILLLRERNFILYTLSLFLCVFSNYYIGFFVCIFVFLLFWVYEICRFGGFKKLFFDFTLIGVFTVLALGMTLILELPAMAALQTTQSSVNQFPEKFALNIVDKDLYSGFNLAYESFKGALKAGQLLPILTYGWESFRISFTAIFVGMIQVAGNMGGGVVPTFKEGLPNIYCGVGTIILALLFLFNGKVKVRDKLCSTFLLLLFMLSFLLRQLDYIWHGFHFTNMIPYRFSFLFCFVMLYMAYRAWLIRDSFKLWQIILSGVVAISIFSFSATKDNIVYLAFNFVFLTLYLFLLILPKLQRKLPKDTSAEGENVYNQVTDASVEDKIYYDRVREFNKKASAIGMCVIISVEIVFSVINFGTNFPYTTVSNYPKGTEDTASMIRYMKEREDSLFYRAEVTHAQTLNDGALNNYQGISTFTSSANVKVTEFMKALGYGAKNTYNRYCYEESSPVSNLFLGIKYMIERDGLVEDNAYFEEVHHFGNVYLLENNAYLPLGFLANSNLSSANFQSTGDSFYFQNRLMKLATGIEQDVWIKFGNDQISIDFKDVTPLNSGQSGYAHYNSGASSGNVTFTFTANTDGFACINLTNLSKKNSYRVSLNGQDLYSETYSLPQMLAVSDVKAGDQISVRFTCKANEQGTINATAAVLDEALFRKAYDILNASTLEITHFESSLVKGTIDCDRDGLLYTSIPQNGNWHAYVDGEEVEITLVGGCMIGIPLTKGSHTVVFRYQNEAFSLGWKISLACAAIFFSITAVTLFNRRKQGKYQRSHNS